MTKLERDKNHRVIRKIKKELLKYMYLTNGDIDVFVYNLGKDVIPEEYERRLISNFRMLNILVKIADGKIYMKILDERYNIIHKNDYFRKYRKDMIIAYLNEKESIWINKKHLKAIQIKRLIKYLCDYDIECKLIEERYGYQLLFIY